MKTIFLLITLAFSLQGALAQITNVNATTNAPRDTLAAAFSKLNTNDNWLSTQLSLRATNTLAGITNALGYIPAANTSAVPSGVIVMWSGSLANVPSGWALCDGNNGTPDLREKFIKGWTNAVAPGGTGGSNSYTPAGTVSQPTFTGTESTTVLNHTHTATVTDPGHAHTQSYNSSSSGSGTGWQMDTSASASWTASSYNTTTNTTGIVVTNAAPAGGSASYTPAGTVSQPTFTGTAADVSPAYYVLAFIMKL